MKSYEIPAFKSGPPPYNLGPPFDLSIVHMIPWNSPNGGMDEGNVWVGSTIQTNRNQNASNREDFEDDIRLSLCDCGNAPTSNSRNKRNGYDPHGTHPLPIWEMELTGVY